MCVCVCVWGGGGGGQRCSHKFVSSNIFIIDNRLTNEEKGIDIQDKRPYDYSTL